MCLFFRPPEHPWRGDDLKRKRTHVYGRCASHYNPGLDLSPDRNVPNRLSATVPRTIDRALYTTLLPADWKLRSVEARAGRGAEAVGHSQCIELQCSVDPASHRGLYGIVSCADNFAALDPRVLGC